MKSRIQSEIGFAAAFLIPAALYLGGGATLAYGGYWLMQPTVIENSKMIAYRGTQAAVHRPPAQKAPISAKIEPPNPIASSTNRQGTIGSTGRSAPSIHEISAHKGDVALVQSQTAATQAIAPKNTKTSNRTAASKKPTVAKTVKENPREQFVERQDHLFWGPTTSRGLF
jgi:hypothetical protein